MEVSDSPACCCTTPNSALPAVAAAAAVAVAAVGGIAQRRGQRQRCEPAAVAFAVGGASSLSHVAPALARRCFGA